MWTIEQCFAEALKYSTRCEFRDNESGKYQRLRRAGKLDEACAHMDVVRRKITDAMIFAEAKKFSIRLRFRDHDPCMYMAAYKRGILDAACAHMVIKKRRLSDEELAVEARKYSARGEFALRDNGAYQTATKRGILDTICAHMPDGDRRLTDDEIIAVARTYRTRRAFKEGDFGAYTTALRRGLETVACAHMSYGFAGFREDLPGALYRFRVRTPGGLVLYKIGITNRPTGRRLASMGLLPGVSAELLSVINFESGRDARITEKRLHRKLSSHRYCGPPVMKNGNTELFTVLDM